MFLALTVADPEDATTNRIRSMDESQVIKTLRNTLDKEFQMLYRQSDANLNIIGLIRHVLVQSGGAQNLAQLDLLNDKWRDIHSPAVFAALMGISPKVRCTNRNPAPTLISQLAQTQCFANIQADWRLVTKMTQQLKLPFWGFITVGTL